MWTIKMFNKTGAVLGNVYPVGIYLLGVDMGRLQRRVKYVQGQQWWQQSNINDVAKLKLKNELTPS